MSMQPVTKAEAIAELLRIGGDVNEGIADSLQRGFMEVGGRDERDGELRFRLTAAGKARVETMIQGDQ